MKPTATHTSLILTGTDADAPPADNTPKRDTVPQCPLNFDQVKHDRRRAPRQVVEELVTAVFHDGPDRVLVSRVLLTDVSHTGLGCACEKPLAPGAKVTLTSRGVPMPHKSGTVVRCWPVSGGFMLGVSLDRQRAVA